ncbi:YihY/virulence factor BrkB family protein [Adhaeribacter soli]|uniref:YihY/virulence factor BrkB family protein n=1 Tax=Adhaeribacter soli TaxID=2607655 RepID=A0A5N1J1L3_9BACT|nr:YihY/virulence factor BrkB family protein [Adhaeribacter soli]KAA9340304.1 YihY/virulence factor BrkB family protein [Adhaeribacter soli]
MPKITAKAALSLSKNAFDEFMNNNSFRLAAALSYNTIFSLPPLLVIILIAAGSIFGEEAMSGELHSQAQAALGAEAAKEIQSMIASASQLKKSGLAAVIGIVMLIFAATTFFITLQDSLNTIWNIKPKPKSGIMQMVKARFLSFGLILSVALLLLVSFVVSAALTLFSDYLRELLPDVTVVLFKILDFIISVGIITALFALIFKYLPDAIIRWKDVWPGALLTALLFVIGKFLIGWYLSFSDVGSAYGAAGSVIIILVWIYYSSLIVFFGAEFTQQYVNRFGAKVRPKSYAVHYVIKEEPYVDPDVAKAGRPEAEGRFRE